MVSMIIQRPRTSPVHDFLCVAHERSSSIFRVYVQLLSVGPEVLGECSQCSGINFPSIFRSVLVE